MVNSNSKTRLSSLLLVLVAACAAWSIYVTRDDALVVYCAHDSVYSEKLLREFEQQTGIPVVIRFDTESTKSLGLVHLLIAEKANPQCDVFWNNELLGMLDLKDAGILEPYEGAEHGRIPARYKDPDGHWTGFAGRLRVVITNTDKLPANEQQLTRRVVEAPQSMSIAKPLYGTTRTHYTLLWKQWGRDKLLAWHRDLRQRGLVEAQGNAMVKNIVAAAKCDFGWTDTDDFYMAVDNGKPVDIVPARLETGETICIPNTVAIIKGTPRMDAAQQLVDFLLSAETEISLANSKSRQIPLGNVPADKIPMEVQQLQAWAHESCDLRQLTDVRNECLDWLKGEYLE